MKKKSRAMIGAAKLQPQNVVQDCVFGGLQFFFIIWGLLQRALIPQNPFSGLQIPYRTFEIRRGTCDQSTPCKFASEYLKQENYLLSWLNVILMYEGRFFPSNTILYLFRYFM